MADSSPGFFGRIAAAVMARPRRTAGLVLLACFAALLLATRIRINPNILELLPADDPTTKAIKALNEEEGGANLLTIAVVPANASARPSDRPTGPDDPLTGASTDSVVARTATAPDHPPGQADLDAFMQVLQQRFQAMDEVDYALYDVSPDLAWRIGLMQLQPSELKTIRDRLKAALALGPAATNPFVAARLLDLGPLTAKLKQEGQVPILAGPGGTARLLVRPVGSAYDPRFSRPFMHKVYKLLDEMDPAAHGLRIAWVGGAYRHAYEDLQGITYDLRWTSLASLAFVFILISLAFRDLQAILLVFVPLIAGNVLTVGFAGVTVGTLNTFTSFFAAVLIGLGIDFGIHLYARYQEERARGGSVEETIVRTWDAVGPPCATAALTSAVAFCALWTAGFKGFQQLGTLLAGGVVLCLGAVLVVMPLLIRWREAHPRAIPMRRRRKPPPKRRPTYPWAVPGLALFVLFSIGCVAMLPKVGFQYDLSELRRRGLAYADLDAQEQQLAQASYSPVVVSYPDAESLARDHARLTQAIAAGEIPEIGTVLSIYSVLPTDQPARIDILRQIAQLAHDPNVKYLPPQVRQNLTRIASSNLEPMTAQDLPRGLRHLLGASDGHHRLLLIPAGNMWDLRETPKLRDAIDKWLPGRPAASEYLAQSALYRMIKDDAPRVVLLALVLVTAVTMLDLGKVGRALGAVGALAAGMCWAGAGMALFDVKLSMVNFVAIPMLMGIGIDVVIHLSHRLNEEGPGRVRWALSTTGWAAALSTATTVVSFAALLLASSQGVRSLGLVITLGLSLVTGSAFAVVPLGWMIAWKLSGKLATLGEEEEEANATA